MLDHALTAGKTDFHPKTAAIAEVAFDSLVFTDEAYSLDLIFSEVVDVSDEVLHDVVGGGQVLEAAGYQLPPPSLIFRQAETDYHLEAVGLEADKVGDSRW